MSVTTSELLAISSVGQRVFMLELPQMASFACSEVVRVVPEKRVVCRGAWNSQSVYAKLFMGRDAQRYARRDKAGVESLKLAAIKTPDLLAESEIKGGYVLIFSEIADAQNAEQNYQHANFEQRTRLAKSLVLAVAQHHNANLIQTDLYLKNFLVRGEKIYTLDGDGIRKYARLGQQQALKNLCVLLSKFDVLEIESWLPGLLKTYSEVRAWQVAPDAELIKKMTDAYRQKATSNYAEKKVFRQCTDVAVSSSSKIFTAISSEFLDLDLPQTSQKLDSLVTSQNLLKNGNTCTVARVEIGHRPIVIKRYNIKSFWHGVNRAPRQTRAAVSWANAHRLKLLDIPTAKPVALIEDRKLGLKGKAYFLCEYIDAPDAAQFFAECTDKNARSEAVKNIATLFYKLYLLRISHGDTKASNIKIVDHKPVLIDLDSMVQHNFTFTALRAHARDLRRFMQNWKQAPAMYNAFVKAFKVVYADNVALKLAKISE